MNIFHLFWPTNLYTPHIALGISEQEGKEILHSIGEISHESDGSLRVGTDIYDLAIYIENGVVKSVWFNDPLGRLFPVGKRKKVKLYLARYGALDHWEKGMDNGWMHYWFNEVDGVQMVYGIHNDVIRFNLQA